MKYIYIKITILALIFSTYSCSAGWLDLEPSDAASIDNTIYDVKSAEGVLAGVYDAIQGNSDYPLYYGAGMIYYGEVRGDDMQATKANGRTSWAYLMDYEAGLTSNMWVQPYKVIRRANSLIKSIDEGRVLGGTAEEVGNIKGQALVARALAHFDLLRIFARAYDVEKNGNEYGVPVITAPAQAGGDTNDVGRATVSATFAQIETDLNDALDLHISTKIEKGYFNAWAAKLLLARVYLYKNTKADLEKAYKLCAEDIIPNSPAKLWTNADYTKVWAKEGTSEVLFEVVSTSTDDWVDREAIGYLCSEGDYDDLVMTKSFIEFLEKSYVGDVRCEVMKAPEVASNKTKYNSKKVYTLKYPGTDNADNRVGSVILLRLSEAYLIASEAAMKLNDKANAVKYLNSIVERGNPTATKVTESTVSLDRILDERRVEFVAEGHRFFDLIRNGKKIVRYTSIGAQGNQGWHLPISNKDAQSFNPDYYKVILPIPLSEVLANPTIAEQQNLGY